MPQLSSTRFLILGGGAVVTEFHLPALARLGWLDGVRVVDPSPAAAARIAAQFPGVTVVTGDYGPELRGVRTGSVDAVLVALPNVLHEEATRQALDQGFDVLCEKPLALTSEACRRLAGTATARGRVLAVGMVRRFHPALQAARRAIAAGWVGEVRAIDVEWGGAFAWPSDSGHYFRAENAGVLANLGVHSLDLAEYLVGPLTPVRYRDDWGGGVEANADFALTSQAGANVRIRLSYTDALKNEVRIQGTRADVTFGPDDALAILREVPGGLRTHMALERPFEHGDWPSTITSCFLEQFANFGEAVARRQPACATAEDAARTAELIDWAYATHRSSVAAAGPARKPLEPGRVFVTGGTGFLGGHLIEALAATGSADIVLPVRSYRSGANAGRFPVQMTRTSLLDVGALRASMEGVRFVFHLAFGRDGHDASRVTVEGTRNVVQAAIDAGVESVVVLSTTALLGEMEPGAEVDEAAPYETRNDYERTKAEAERVVLALAKKSGRTRVVVVNSSCIYGPRGGAFTELPARLRRDGGFSWIEGGRGVINYVYVENLVDALFLAATCVSARGERFIVSDGSTTWREFFTGLLGSAAEGVPSFSRQELTELVAGQAPGWRDLARAVLDNAEVRRVIRDHRTLARVKSLASRATPSLFDRLKSGRPSGAAAESDRAVTPALPPVWLADLYGPGAPRVSAGKARRVLGWSPRVDLAHGQALSRAWLEEVGLLEDAGLVGAAR